MRSGYVIKPAALFKAQEIRQVIELSGLRIVARTNLTLTQDDVALMDCHIAEACINPGHMAWVGAEVEVGVVEGEQALAHLLALTGRDVSSTTDETYPQPKRFSTEAVRATGQLCLCDVIFTPADEVEAAHFLRWYHPVHFRQVREAVMKALRQHCEEEERWKHHFWPVVKYARQLAASVGADMEVVELAAWLHDITRMQGDIEHHHLTGAEAARQLLEDLHYDAAKIDNICHCIITHRGSKLLPIHTVEAEIVASADAMAHIVYAPSALFNVKRKKINKAAKMIRKKAKRNWKRIMQEGKEIIQPHYAALEVILSHYKSVDSPEVNR